MALSPRHAVLGTLLAAALGPVAAQAQACPNRPVRLLVGFAAGTSPQAFGAIIAAYTQTWGKAVAATGFKAD